MKIKYIFHMEATLLFQVAQNYNRKLRFLKQVWAGPQSSRRYRIPKFLDSRHMKVVRLSAPRTGRFYPQEIPYYSLLLEAVSTPGPQCGRKDYANEKYFFLKLANCNHF